jgi:hypothetical protein
MSNAALLKVYDGLDPELAFLSAPGTTPDLTQVLTEGAAASNIAITGLGDLTFGSGDTITGPSTALLQINSGAGQGVSVSGVVGASLVSQGASGCAVTAGGALTLTAATAQPDGLVLAGAGLAPAASAGPNIIVTHIISFKSGATTYWLPVLSAAPTA